MEPVKRNNYYEFPTIRVATRTGKTTLCTILCGLVKHNADKNIFKSLDEPSDIGNLAVRLKDDYSDNSIITDNIKGFIVLHQGFEGGKVSFKDATFITSGKNLGKANQTNVWTQTLAQAKSKYADKNRTNDSPELFRPMLANGEAVSADLLADTVYELHDKYENNYYVQYKYDGHRMVCRLRDQFCYTRTAEKTHVSQILFRELGIVNEHIRSALSKYANYNIYLDGEYYYHGTSLQQITSAVRSEEQSEEKDKLLYYVFDVPMTTQDGKIAPIECKERLLALATLQKFFASYNLTNIVFVQTWAPKEAKRLGQLYMTALKNKYEGLVLKIADGLYEPGHNNYHSRQMVKIKELLREEFRVTGFKTGKGKSEGKIILQCAITEDNVSQAVSYMRRQGRIFSICPDAARGTIFSVTPALTAEESEDLYKKVLAEEIDIIGKLYTVEFRDWSDKLLPIQPVGISFFG